MELTPKEKAEELFNKYFIYLRANLLNDEEAIEDAKVCALIAVDRNIKMLNEFLNTMDGWMHEAKCAVMELIENEEELKKEIEKL